ncbi:MAG: hypothetical protein HUU54_03000, partial [Ignavibacteriaceae bacterium]|nr:hypothetical protein [Ignavibacteriaceae bacterium]
ALLVNGEQPAGYYEYEFGNPVIAEELKGIKLASGTYICRLDVRDAETGNPVYSHSIKMLYVK